MPELQVGRRAGDRRVTSSRRPGLPRYESRRRQHDRLLCAGAARRRLELPQGRAQGHARFGRGGGRPRAARRRPRPGGARAGGYARGPGAAVAAALAETIFQGLGGLDRDPDRPRDVLLGVLQERAQQVGQADWLAALPVDDRGGCSPVAYGLDIGQRATDVEASLQLQARAWVHGLLHATFSSPVGQPACAAWWFATSWRSSRTRCCSSTMM